MFIKQFKRFATSVVRITKEDLGKAPELDFVVTSDFHRVDIGLIVCRRPIFWALDEIEVSKLEKEHNITMKYDRYPYVNADLFDFDRKHLSEEPRGPDEEYSHEKKLADGTTVYYREHSKYFKYADPNVMNNKLIQHASCYNTFLLFKKEGKWLFPNVPISAKDSLNTAKEKFMGRLSCGTWSYYLPSKYPHAVMRTPIETKELSANEYLKKCVGRKIYYFNAYHDNGPLTKVPEGYEDFAWVTKPEMNKYLDRDDFDFFMKYLNLTN
jgi:hypothetical protein